MLKGVEAVATLTHNSIQVLHNYGLIKTRSAYGVSFGVITDNIFFYNNSLQVVLRALTERLYYVKGKDGFVPCPRPSVSFANLHYFTKAVRRNMPGPAIVWTTEEFVRSYTGSKAKRYASAALNLARRGARRNFGYLKTFIKAEFYNGRKKKNPCPRLIQPRSPEYNILIGRYLRPIEKMVYKSIDRVYKHHVVLKCDSAWKRADHIAKYWKEFSDPCFVGLDASRFDQHVSAEALKFEHGLYNSIFHSHELAEYLRWQIDNVGFANLPDGAVKYKVNGCRMSGDMNTALGNVYLMCAMTHSFLSNLPSEVKWRFINDGDDCGIFIDRKHLHLLETLPEHHLGYGFEMEVEAPVYNMEDIEFCQSRPVELSPGKYMMVRNIHKAMAHDWINIRSRNYATFEELSVATGRCGLALYADVPVLSEMYAAMTRFAHREDRVCRILEEEFSGIGRTWRMFASAKRDILVDETCARVSIYKAFGILPDTQRHYEAVFRAFDPLTLSQPKLPLYSIPDHDIQYYLD